MKKNGFTLIELILCLSILLLFSSSLIKYQKNISKKWNTYYGSEIAFQFLHSIQNNAETVDADISLTIENNTLLSNSNILKSYQAPSETKLKTNQSQLGFKGSGNTKFAGTLTLSSTELEKEISIGVGIGKITLKN